jgi:hypothetical protein
MAGIKQPILDVMSKLSSITVTNGDNNPVPLFTRIWNKQIDYLKDGSGYAFARPAAFVEVINNATYQTIGQGFRSADIGFRIHLIADSYNEIEGTMEQFLGIFDLRDKVIANANNPSNAGLSFFVPTDCSPLNCVSEEQDYSHDNIYHYILDFVCNFTDSKASAFDTGAGQYDDTANPNMDTQSNVSKTLPTPTQPSTNYFIIPQ